MSDALVVNASRSAKTVRFVMLGLAVLAASCTSGKAPRSESSPSPSSSPSPVAEVATTTAVPRSADCNSREKTGDEVRVVVRYRCLAVRGETGAELIRELARGGRRAGTGRWGMQHTIRWSGFEGGTCSMDSVSVQMDLEYLFPRWVGSSERQVELVSAWSDLIVAMERNADRLQQGVLRTGEAVRDDLIDFSSPCSGFESAAKKLARRSFDRHSDRLEERAQPVDFDLLEEPA